MDAEDRPLGRRAQVPAAQDGAVPSQDDQQVGAAVEHEAAHLVFIQRAVRGRQAACGKESREGFRQLEGLWQLGVGADSDAAGRRRHRGYYSGALLEASHSRRFLIPRSRSGSREWSASWESREPDQKPLTTDHHPFHVSR